MLLFPMSYLVVKVLLMLPVTPLPGPKKTATVGRWEVDSVRPLSTLLPPH